MYFIVDVVAAVAAAYTHCTHVALVGSPQIHIRKAIFLLVKHFSIHTGNANLSHQRRRRWRRRWLPQQRRLMKEPVSSEKRSEYTFLSRRTYSPYQKVECFIKTICKIERTTPSHRLQTNNTTREKSCLSVYLLLVCAYCIVKRSAYSNFNNVKIFFNCNLIDLAKLGRASP